jgi:hypothetical protein
MLITIKENGNEIEKAIQKLSGMPKETNLAITRAANRAIQQAKTAGSKKTRSTYNIQKSNLDSRINIIRGNMAKFIVRGRPLKAVNFRNTRRKKGVFVQVKKGQGGLINGAFYTVVNSGLGIFTRRTKKRLPIDMKYGPSVAQMFGNPDVVEEIKDVGAKAFETRLKHEVERILER